MKIRLFLMLCFFAVTATKAFNRAKVNDKDVLGTRVFIENKGQFNSAIPENTNIQYAFENGDEKVYFTEKGLVYKLAKHFAISEKEMEAMEKGKLVVQKPDEVYYVNMNWVNCNANIQISESEKQSYYFSYGGPEYNSYGYKKITYKNVYNNIDIEYTIPEDKAYGIKYNVILHPGANPADIQIAYSGDVNNIIKKGGDIVIKTPLEDITEHFPSSFYKNGGDVKTEFNLVDDKISFNFPEGYNNSKTLIIDPWVVTLTTLQTNNYAYDVDFDYVGNTFVYGGYNPFKVGMFDVSGTLLWVFAGTVGSQGWSSAPILSQASNFVVNKFNSKTYIGQGYAGGGNRVIRLDANGNYDNFINTANSNFQEVWDMGFYCATGDVFGLGGGVTANISAAAINQSNAALTLSTFQPTNNSVGQDIVCHAIDDLGAIFVCYATGFSALNNKLCKVNTTFNGNIWTQPSTYATFGEQQNKNQYQGAGTLNSNGFNCLAVNSNYLYYYDGFNLAAYNKATGAQIAATTITGFVIKRQGGIAVDDCDNIYIGGNNGTVEEYKFNGTSFTSIGSIPLGINTTNKYVYDIRRNKNTNLLHVCGSGFVGTFNAAVSTTCTALNQFNIVTSCQGNSNGSAVANVTTNIGSPTYNYTWTQGTNTISITSNTTASSNTVTGLANGIYTIIIQINAPCGPVFVNTVNINCLSTCSAVVSGSLSCPNGGSANSFSLFVNSVGGFTSTPTYTWTGPGAFNSNQQNPVFPNGAYGTYTVTVSNGGCTYSTTVNMPNPIITPTIATNGMVTCVTGAQVWANGVPAGYSYSWSPTSGIVGSNTTQTITVNQGGIYTCTIINIATGCSASAPSPVVVQDITVTPVSISPGSGIIQCGLPATTFTGSPAPLSNYTYQWYVPCGPPFAGYICLPGCAGVYTFEATNTLNGCISTKTVLVTSNPAVPSITISAQANNYYVTCVTCVTMQISASISGGGGIGVRWMDPTMATTLTTSNTYSTCIPGNYIAYAYALAAPNCSVAQMVTVLQNTVTPNAGWTSTTWGPMQNATLTCNNPCVVMTGTSTATSYSVAWNIPAAVTDVTLSVCSTTNQAQTTVSTPSVVITDLVNGCVKKLPVPVYQDIKTVTLTAKATPSLLTCSVIQSQLQYTPNPIASLHTWTWTTPPPSSTYAQVNPINTYAPGVYTIEATNTVNGCKSSQTVAVGLNNLPPAVLPVSDATIACGSLTAQINSGVTSTVGLVYFWDGPVGSGIQSITSASPSVNMTGIYTVQITSTITGCRSENTVVVVAGALTVTFTADPMTGYAPLNVNFTNQSTPGSTTFWGYGNGTTQFSTLTINGNTTYNSPGTYTVILISQKGICIDSAETVIVVDIPSKMEVPNVFTPNGDGINDNFILHTANLSDITVTIYDRWGLKMYEVTTEKGNISWDGKNLAGKEVPAGTYFWIVKANGKDGVDYNQKGNVTIYR